MKSSWVYILQCSDDSYYTGCTTNIEKRISEHAAGLFEGYTASRRPVHLVFSQQFSDIRGAIRAERQIKNWSRGKKAALIAGDFALLHELAACRNDSHSKNLSKPK